MRVSPFLLGGRPSAKTESPNACRRILLAAGFADFDRSKKCWRFRVGSTRSMNSPTGVQFVRTRKASQRGAFVNVLIEQASAAICSMDDIDA
jgi:hypothetical protein